MEFLIVLAILAVVAAVVTAPLRRSRSGGGSGDSAGESSAMELTAQRDAKYREIRDAELDHRTGKLSDSDYEAIDRSLRAEAIEILRALDGVRGE